MLMTEAILVPCAVLATEASFPGAALLHPVALKGSLSTTGLRGLMGKWD